MVSHVKSEALRGPRASALEGVTQAVVTIPVNMTGPRRAALRDAFRRADIGITQFVHEPLAALYGYFRSSAAYRVRIALNLKGLSADHRFIHLRKGEQTQDAYRRINPAGLVPYWIDDDLELAQSIAIIEYLDETHPHPPLLPPDAALPHLPVVALDGAATDRLRMGQTVSLAAGNPGLSQPGLARVYGPGGTFLGIGEILPGAALKPVRLFNNLGVDST